jgi:hypothetical protein
MRKKTRWFPVSLPPTRVGVYETRSTRSDSIYYSYWDGANFHGEWYTPERAMDNADWAYGQQMAHWRGVVKP